MTEPLKVRFKALENGVPDVIVNPSKSPGYRLIRQFDSLIEGYVNRDVCLCLDLGARSKMSEHDLVPTVLGALGTARSDEAGSGDGSRELHGGVQDRQSGDCDSPVLVPVVYFVQQPEGVLLDRTHC